MTGRPRRVAFWLMLGVGTCFNLAVSLVATSFLVSGNLGLLMLEGEMVPLGAAMIAAMTFGEWTRSRAPETRLRAILTGMGSIVAAVVAISFVGFFIVRGVRASGEGISITDLGFFGFVFDHQPVRSLMEALFGPLLIGSLGLLGMPEICGGLIGYLIWRRIGQMAKS
jgi:hypothetical protein